MGSQTFTPSLGIRGLVLSSIEPHGSLYYLTEVEDFSLKGAVVAKIQPTNVPWIELSRSAAVGWRAELEGRKA